MQAHADELTALVSEAAALRVTATALDTDEGAAMTALCMCMCHPGCTVKACARSRHARLTTALTAAANLHRRFLPKPLSLAAVIADDARLVGLSEAQIVAEVRAQVGDTQGRLGCRRRLLLAPKEQASGSDSCLPGRPLLRKPECAAANPLCVVAGSGRCQACAAAGPTLTDCDSTQGDTVEYVRSSSSSSQWPHAWLSCEQPAALPGWQQ